MSNKPTRELVLPGDVLADSTARAGPGTRFVGDKLVATTAGLADRRGEELSVLPLNGVYEPRPGDLVVGLVQEVNPGNWIVDIRAPWPAPLHVSEAPWRVDFGETAEYLKQGDAMLCKVLFVDEQKKVQVTLKDRNLAKLEGGELVEVPAVKVARLIGKNGSMLNLLKSYLECWMHVGQNGRIWLNGDAKEIVLAKRVIQMIVQEAHLPGVTDRVKAFLEAERPGGVDASLIVVDDDFEPEAPERTDRGRRDGGRGRGPGRGPGGPRRDGGRGRRDGGREGGRDARRGGDRESGRDGEGRDGGRRRRRGGRGRKNAGEGPKE